MENRLNKISECINSINNMMDELIKCGVKVNGNSLQGVYRELAITLVGDTCSSPRGMTDQGTSIKVRTAATGKDGVGQSIVDDMDLDNSKLKKVVVVVLDRYGNVECICSADSQTILKHDVSPKNNKYVVGLPKFRSYATKLF